MSVEGLDQYFLHDGPPTKTRKTHNFIAGATKPDEPLTRPGPDTPEVSGDETLESCEVRAVTYDKDLAPYYYHPDHQAILPEKKRAPNPNGTG